MDFGAGFPKAGLDRLAAEVPKLLSLAMGRDT